MYVNSPLERPIYKLVLSYRGKSDKLQTDIELLIHLTVETGIVNGEINCEIRFKRPLNFLTMHVPLDMTGHHCLNPFMYVILIDGQRNYFKP